MRYLVLIAAVVLAMGCKKPPGEGGSSHIRGKVMKEVRLVLSNPSTKLYTLPAADEDVYIIYGDHVSSDHRLKTNFDGEFEFRNLREGKYRIYVYSKDTTGLAGVDPNRMPVVVDVEITDKNQTIELEDLWIYDN